MRETPKEYLLRLQRELPAKDYKVVSLYNSIAELCGLSWRSGLFESALAEKPKAVGLNNAMFELCGLSWHSGLFETALATPSWRVSGVVDAQQAESATSSHL